MNTNIVLVQFSEDDNELEEHCGKHEKSGFVGLAIMPKTVPIVTMRCDYNAEFLSSCTSENYSE